MGKRVSRGLIVRLLVVTAVGIAAVAMLSMSAFARSARSTGHVRREHSSLLSVRYLSHNRHNQLVPGMGSTRRRIKHGPLGPQRRGHASRAAVIGAKRAALAARFGKSAAANTRPSIKNQGCAVPSAPGAPAATGGANQASVSWTAANGNGSTVTAYVVTAMNGTTAENAQGEPASATTATLTGLSGASYTFTIFAQSACGNGPAATTAATTVTGGATYASTVISLAPSAYFRLGEPAGSVTAADSSGHGLLAGIDTNSGIVFGATGALASDPATSVNDTNGEWVASAPTPNGLPVSNQPRTVQAWVKPNDANCRWVLGWGQNNTDQGYSLAECPNQVEIDAYNDIQSFATPEPINDGAWHMITVTYDGTNATAYLDGRSLGTRQFANPLSTATGPLELGAYESNCCNNWTYGGLQDEAVYPTALTAAQVTSLFKASGYAVPTTPGSPAATSTSNNTATVTWNDSTASGTSVTGYIVTAKKGTTVEQAIGTPATATSATLTGLPSGSTTFTVTAVDDYGNSTAATSAPVTVAGSATTYASTVATDKPAVFYRLDEPTGSLLMADSGSGGYFGHYANSCLTLGVAGPLQTDPATGASSSACNDIGFGGKTSALPAGDTTRTMQAWIKPSDTNCRYFMGYGGTYTDGEFGIGNCGNSVLLRLYGDDHSFYSARNIADGNWHLVTVSSTYSATTGQATTAYLDTQKLGTVYSNQLNTQSNTPLEIGGDPSDCCYYGGVADAAVFAKALSVSQIAAELTAGGDGVPTAPTDVTASPGTNKATITWNASTAPGATVTSYVVTELSAGKAQQSIAVPGTATKATIDSLAAGSYTFSVVAYDTYGVSTAGTTSSSTAVTGATTTYASDTIASAPALYYRLGETGTSVAADSSGHNVIGAYDLNNTTQGVSGAINDGSDLAASQNGGGFMVEAGGSTTIPSGDSARTLEAWVKPSDGYCNRYVAGFGTTSTDQGFAIAECPNDVIVDAYSDTKNFYTPRVIDDGSWHMLAATYTDANGVDEVTAYLDGVSLGTKSFTGTLATPPNSTLWIGAGPNDCCTSFYGGIDEVAVFPTALTAATISGQFALSSHALPAAPTGVGATGGSNEATVSWTAASSPDPLTGYLVTAYSGTTVKGSVGAPASATSATISGLAAGSYTFKVVALDSYGTGPAGTSAAVTVTGSATTYQSTVLGDGPVADYTLAEPSGTAYAADSSGNTLTANYNQSVTTYGNPGAIPTDPATSVSDNANGPVAVDTIVPGNKLPAANQPRTMVAWVKPSDTNCRYAMGFGSEANDESFGMYVCQHSVDVVGWNDDETFTTATNIDDGNWHQIVVTYDGTNDAAYVDGQLIGTAAPSQTLNTPTDSALYLGAGANQAGNYWYGGLDDEAVFGTALSASQVSTLFSASGYGVPTAPSNVVATPGTNDATVSWNPATAPNTTVTAYVVTALKNGTTAANAVATSGSASSVTIHGLTASQAYTFQVVAHDTYGAGPSATSASEKPTGSNSPVQFAQQVISDGAVAYYRLGETSGNVAADSSGNGVLGTYNTNNVTLGGAGALTHDPSTSISDNGSYAMVTPALPNLLPTGGASRSEAIWFKTTSGGCQYLMGYGTMAAAEDGSSLNECSSSTTSLTFDGWGETVSVTDSTALDNGNWHFFVATYNAGSVSFYIDGAQVGTAQTLSSVLTTPANSPLYIGSELEDYGGYSGSLQDAAVFPAALTTAQVSTLYGDR